MDRVLKPAEYAAAGIPYYWRVETEPEVTVVAFRLSGGEYEQVRELRSGTEVLPGPWPVRVAVAALSEGK